MNAHCPQALLIGQAPPPPVKYHYVNHYPYEAVILGLLPPGLLLQMPTEPVCEALLEGLPVYLWADQPYRRAPHGVLLKKLLAEKERLLLSLGARAFGAACLTAEELAAWMALDADPAHRLMTPLAADHWKEKTECCWELSPARSGPPKKATPSSD